MTKINFQNNITKANADTFNTMQDNIEDAIDEASDTLDAKIPVVNNQTTAMVGQKFLFNNNYVIYAGTVVVSFSSGIGYFNVSGLNLSAKPSCVQATICSEYCGIKYDYDNSTATSLKFDLHRNGAVYNKTGNVRFSCTIYEKISS